MDKYKVSRREFLTIGAAAAAGVALAACQKTAVPTVAEKQATVAATKPVEKEKLVTPAVTGGFKESPYVADMVKSGKIPAVAERLPTEPMVISPLEEVGVYGGTIHTGTIYTGLIPDDMELSGGRFPQPLAIMPDISNVGPYLCKAWEQPDDKKSITLFLRKGTKWTDGGPLTVDDFMWWYEYFFLDKDLTPTISAGLRPGGEPMKMEKIDDYTVRYVFAGPAATFLASHLAHLFDFWSGYVHQASYMKEYHIKTNPKAADLAKAAGFDYWYQLYGRQRNRGQNVDAPGLAALRSTGQTPDSTMAERNPYYWCVDTAGNQLPYVDKWLADRLADRDLQNAKVLTGEYDFTGFNTDLQSYSAYSDASEAGNYRVLLWNRYNGSDTIYNFNMNYFKDEVLRQIHLDKRYRQAMSMAINRDEINKVIYYGRGVPRQLTVTSLSRWYKPEYAQAYAKYDPDAANKLLDEMGLKWNDAHTQRLRPDGQPLEYIWDYYPSEVPEKGPTTEMCLDYWAAVGIKMTIKGITRELLTPKITSNDEPMSLWHGDECNDILFALRPKWFAPIDGDESCWGVLWGRWYTSAGKSEQGVEPPQEIKDLYTWLDNYNMYGTEEWARKLLQSQAENIWTIGVVGEAPHPLIARKNLRNFQEMGMWNWDDLWTYPYYPEQWFFKP